MYIFNCFLCRGQVNALQTSDGHKYGLGMSRVGDLETFESPSKYTASFRYHHTSGLLKSKLDNENMAYVYEYDEYGRLVSTVTPTGEVFGLRFNLTARGASIDVTKDNLPYEVVLVQDNLVSVRRWTTLNDRAVRVGADKTLTSEDEAGTTVAVATIPHPVNIKKID
jgi:YD repeat-containing protein